MIQINHNIDLAFLKNVLKHGSTLLIWTQGQTPVTFFSYSIGFLTQRDTDQNIFSFLVNV